MKNSVKIVMNKKNTIYQITPSLVQVVIYTHIHIHKYITERLHGDGVKIYIHIVQSLLKNHL